MKSVLALFALLALASCVDSPAPAAPPIAVTRPAPEIDGGLIPQEKIKRDARGEILRSRRVIAAFQARVPCPNIAARNAGNGYGRRGACPGFEADHIIPLCLGGHDAFWNLQWLSIEAHDLKTPGDVAACRRLRAEQGERRSP